MQKILERKANSLPAKHPDAEKRTIFVGNIPVLTKRKQLRKLFAKYGRVIIVLVLL